MCRSLITKCLDLHCATAEAALSMPTIIYRHEIWSLFGVAAAIKRARKRLVNPQLMMDWKMKVHVTSRIRLPITFFATRISRQWMNVRRRENLSRNMLAYGVLIKIKRTRVSLCGEYRIGFHNFLNSPLYSGMIVLDPIRVRMRLEWGIAIIKRVTYTIRGSFARGASAKSGTRRAFLSQPKSLSSPGII